MLLSSGLVEEAYTRHGLRANRGGTYLAMFRAVAKKYPHKPSEQILADLVGTTPGEEGKWFAAAKELGLHTATIELARTLALRSQDPRSGCARPATTLPAFAVEAGCAALAWLSQGFGYEITGADVWMVYSSVMKAAKRLATRRTRRSESASSLRGARASWPTSSAARSSSRADPAAPPESPQSWFDRRPVNTGTRGFTASGLRLRRRS